MKEKVFGSLPFNEEIIIDTPKLHEDGYVWSHLVAKDVKTLHAFAAKIGMKRAWFQDKPGKPHYDIRSKAIRDRAYAVGAIKVSRRYLVSYLKKYYG